MRRWPTSYERKKISAGFFPQIRGDTYICRIFGDKRLHTVNHEVTKVQLFLIEYRLILKYNEIQW